MGTSLTNLTLLVIISELKPNSSSLINRFKEASLMKIGIYNFLFYLIGCILLYCSRIIIFFVFLDSYTPILPFIKFHKFYELSFFQLSVFYRDERIIKLGSLIILCDTLVVFTCWYRSRAYIYMTESIWYKNSPENNPDYYQVVNLGGIKHEPHEVLNSLNGCRQ